MVYKKYIKRGNKRFGPYYYESYREGGKVKTRYIRAGRKIKLQFIIPFIIVFLLLFVSFYKPIREGFLKWTGFEVYVSNCPLADLNGDGKVDGADLAIWQQNYNPLGKPRCDCSNNYCDRADIDRDGDVDNDDKAFWQSEYDPIGIGDCVLPELICESCSDPTDEFTQGCIIIKKNDGSQYKRCDYCRGSILIEYSCDGVNEKREEIVCEYGCKDGACIKKEKPDAEEQKEEIIEPQTGSSAESSSSSGKICQPDWECEEWGECKAEYKLKDVLAGKTVITGKQKRVCIDKNKCKPEKQEVQDCDFVIPVSVRVCKDENYIGVYDESGNLLAVFNRKNLEQRLDINFPILENQIC